MALDPVSLGLTALGAVGGIFGSSQQRGPIPRGAVVGQTQKSIAEFNRRLRTQAGQLEILQSRLFQIEGPVGIGPGLGSFSQAQFDRFREQGLIAGGGTAETREANILGGLQRDIALGNLARQEQGAQGRLAQQFQARGILGSGLEAKSQTGLAAAFGQERARVSTQESLNRLLRQISEKQQLRQELAAFSWGQVAPGQNIGQLAALSQPQQQQGGLAQLGGQLFQQGIAGLLGGQQTQQQPSQGLPANLLGTGIFGGPGSPVQFGPQQSPTQFGPQQQFIS